MSKSIFIVISLKATSKQINCIIGSGLERLNKHKNISYKYQQSTVTCSTCGFEDNYETF